MQLEIEKANKEDLLTILRLQKIVFHDASIRYDRHNMQQLTQTIEEMSKEWRASIILKTVVDGMIVGSVRGRLREDGCYVGKLIVYPDYRNRGIGCRLMAAIEEEFDVNVFELTIAHLEKSIPLYERIGYKIIGGECHRFLHPCPHEERKITTHSEDAEVESTINIKNTYTAGKYALICGKN
jgi:GNAT superfamily N-acetyltransferase